MIQSKRDLKFYIAADRIMNGFPERKSLKEILVNWIDRPVSGLILRYLRAMRYYSYYKNTVKRKFSTKMLLMLVWHRRWNKMSLKLGYSIGPNSLGYGVVLPHHGTIVVNENAQIGNFSVLHTSTCIAGGEKQIGDFFYMSSGSQVVGSLVLGDNVSVAAHSLVNKSFGDNVLLVGTPADVKKKDYQAWYIRDGEKYMERVNRVLKLKKEIYG